MTFTCYRCSRYSLACVLASLTASGCGDPFSTAKPSDSGGAGDTGAVAAAAGFGSGTTSHDEGDSARGGSDAGGASHGTAGTAAGAGGVSGEDVLAAGTPSNGGVSQAAGSAATAGRVPPGGGGDGGISSAGAPPLQPQDPLLVASLDDAQDAVVRIVATGAFRDPADPATYAISVQGSGFIIDPSGLAVTNNHVVAGNARLDVYFNAESEPHNATVLGVSECSDLALIDIEGNDHRYLEWYTEEILAGIDVYTIGYPFGVTSFAMTRGIVSQPRANGETSWSSVDYAILHDATISPGNSGGPLVNAAGEVVGVNYARDADNSQNFAVGREEAYRVLDELREGYDVTSIGISGSVVPLESGHYGIWVAAVGSGSPAAAVGLLPGDVITSLENLPASDEGTFEQYCDTLRSRRSGDALRVDVTRSDTNQLLSGEINGAPLSPVGSTSGGGGTAAAGGTAGAAPTGGTGETGGAGGTAGAAPTGGTGETGGAGGTAGAAPTGGTGETGGAGGTAGTAAIGGTGPTGGSAGSGGAGGTAGTAPTGGAADTGAGGGTAGASAAAAGGREDTPITANLRLRNHVTRADSDSLATVEPSVQDLFIELTVITGTCSDCVEAPVELTAQFSSARRAGRGAASVATTSA